MNNFSELLQDLGLLNRHLWRRVLSETESTFTRRQVRLLTYLAEKGETMMTDLAAKQGVKTPSISAMVDRLVETGLIVRNRNKDDRRVVTVCVSPEGQSELNKIHTKYDAHVDELIEKLPKDKQSALKKVLPDLRATSGLLRDLMK